MGVLRIATSNAAPFSISGLERHSRVEGERELVLGRLLELRAQFFQRRLHGIRSQDLDLGRVAGAGRE
jgi:hypothetical protein